MSALPLPSPPVTASTTTSISTSTTSSSSSSLKKVDDVVGQELIQWLDKNGADSKKLTLQEYAPEVRGVHSCKVLVPGERILVVPKKCLITVEMGKKTDIGRKLLARNVNFVAPKHIYLMMFLLTDMEHVETSFFSELLQYITFNIE
ncbi:unnamed protein product [Peronospora farinosa]|uniref:Uncharacterized protein n=1 Tax=Peronospora farinosa TaxID=134698 RepID=A0ABN8C1F2_9STRA|nr:unnamed protein product [Peronospora farinosa]